MKKLLLAIGIVCIIVCIMFLLAAVLNWHGYHNIFDGSAELYNRLHQRMVTFSVIGIVLAVIGAVCFIFHSKL